MQWTNGQTDGRTSKYNRKRKAKKKKEHQVWKAKKARNTEHKQWVKSHLIKVENCPTMDRIICKYRMQFRLLSAERVCVCVYEWVDALCCLRRYRFKNICACHTHMQTIEREFEHRTAQQHAVERTQRIYNNEWSERRQRGREGEKRSTRTCTQL